MFSADLLFLDWYVENEMKRYGDISFGDMITKTDGEKLPEIINQNISRKRIYTTFIAWDEYSRQNFDFIPVGIVYAVVPRGNVEKVKLLRNNEKLWEQYRLQDLEFKIYDNSQVNNLIFHYAESLNNIGVTYHNLGHDPEAKLFLNKSLNLYDDPEVVTNLKAIK